MQLSKKLIELQHTNQSDKELSKLLKKAIDNKRKSIESKEKLVEILDMLIINRINMVAEIEFTEKRPQIRQNIEQASPENIQLKELKGVSNLIQFFERNTRESCLQ
ncbi:hypothetical protein NEOKW01_0468 [Nematocida sp. AWRm80]|nr:hypothetical protein NEOKW01_0468 [Nematocida sp. AWRm80]